MFFGHRVLVVSGETIVDEVYTSSVRSNPEKKVSWFDVTVDDVVRVDVFDGVELEKH